MGFSSFINEDVQQAEGEACINFPSSEPHDALSARRGSGQFCTVCGELETFHILVWSSTDVYFPPG